MPVVTGLTDTGLTIYSVPISEVVNHDRNTVVITGAASGMGLATARRFAAEDWLVVAVDRDPEALERAAREFDPAAYAPVAADVTDRAALDARFGATLADRTLKAVINAAGIYPPTTLADFTEDDLPPYLRRQRPRHAQSVCGDGAAGSRRRAGAGSSTSPRSMRSPSRPAS